MFFGLGNCVCAYYAMRMLCYRAVLVGCELFLQYKTNNSIQ